jgi:hypothetical protein
VNGASDEWVELYNPGPSSITFDSTWSLQARTGSTGLAACASTAYTTRFGGGGQVIPAHGHILYASSTGFSESAKTQADGTYPAATSLTDAGGVLLLHGGAVVDALCYYFDSTTESTLSCPGNPFQCAGTPVMNPHDNTTGSDNNASLERKPGGAGGNTVNTHDNAADFAAATTADPHDIGSTPVP